MTTKLNLAGNIPLNIDVETKKIGLELILGYLLAEIAELRKENAEIPELREKLLKFAEVEAENAKLKQIIEENARRDSENAELKSRVGELEARLALLEQGSAVDGMALSFGQTQNDKEAMPVNEHLVTFGAIEHISSKRKEFCLNLLSGNDIKVILTFS
ncbi:unnamed protein product [Rhizophagus irregularis]|nr:unnamed protein product [Rhizophagus irregularis]CAB4401281.1 unnamed protein product [Rhizophagus irregularis]